MSPQSARRSSASRTAIVEKQYPRRHLSQLGLHPTKALLRSAEIFHYMQHAKDYGLSAEKVGYDPKPWCSARAGCRSASMTASAS
jgi:pyruvate/2-oxoglutarate dehydrogenase complex dihydrolipoamide dehydrogenase (E3) component